MQHFLAIKASIFMSLTPIWSYPEKFAARGSKVRGLAQVIKYAFAQGLYEGIDVVVVLRPFKFELKFKNDQKLWVISSLIVRHFLY